ncbi:MAG TPA: hypothetical protein VM370_13595 [Candidatus Thermoplasmatota archaeon]|nr:hypothetical protein [Candidatus Thermoplasmatota archaeon]
MKSEPLSKIVQAARERKLFQRERIPLEVKAKAILEYFNGASFRKIAQSHGHQFSAESVRNWWRRMSILFNYPVGKHAIIVADETTLHRGKRVRYVERLRAKGRWKKPKFEWERRTYPPTHLLWVSLNPHTWQIVNIKVSTKHTNEDCYDFLCTTKLRAGTTPKILHDRAPWYVSQPGRVGLEHETVRGGLRSRIECWNRQLKHRLDRFWRAFPWNTSSDALDIWMRAYSALWNLTRP